MLSSDGGTSSLPSAAAQKATARSTLSTLQSMTNVESRLRCMTSSHRKDVCRNYRHSVSPAKLTFMQKLPGELVWLFWDVAVGTVDPNQDADFVLGRVLELGRLVDVRWAVRFYGLERIHCFLREAAHAELSERTKVFWRALLNSEDEEWKSPPPWRRTNSAPWID